MMKLIRFAIRALILTVCVNVLAIVVIAANWSSIRNWASTQLSGPPADWVDHLKQRAKQIQIPDVQNLKAMLPEGLKNLKVVRDLDGK
ncbi:MAG: hypothetical protein JWN70_5784 [Planctomycetaceae bacterium]|nr:hypothetical protein [Planctomycetaceae bacterium]